MAMLLWISRRERRERFTHYGWLGLCPVYVDTRDAEEPLVTERNGVPEWWFNLQVIAFQGINAAMYYADPTYRGYFPIRVGRKIEGA
jgi:hypothetical protein